MSHTACSESTTPDNSMNKNQQTTERIIVAGGCFWCVEGVFEQIEGVIDAESGYCGDSKETADYKTVCSGLTKHAEAVALTYDPNKVKLEQLFEVFFKTHNPTQLNGQGNDIGPQYRSAVFYANDQQKASAQKYIEKLSEEKYFNKPIVTTLEKLEIFYPAEHYHQDYARLNPTQGYVRGAALPKMRKACTLFPDLIKKK